MKLFRTSGDGGSYNLHSAVHHNPIAFLHSLTNHGLAYLGNFGFDFGMHCSEIYRSVFVKSVT